MIGAPIRPIVPGTTVRLRRSSATGGWCAMPDSVLAKEQAEVLSVDVTRIDGVAISEHATLRFPDHGRDTGRLFRCATHYLEIVN